MMRTTSVLAAILACTILVLTGGADAFRTQQSPAIFTQQLATNVDFLNRIRGGAVDVDIESSDEEEESDEEEDAPTLAKSAKKAATKAVKKSVAAALTPKKKKSFSLGNFFKLPYIVKACLNPLVFWQMTAGYWKSLYNINYMQENTADASQDLRSALEQKARYAATAKPRGRKKMKPGQAKTLSDLPALNT